LHLYLENTAIRFVETSEFVGLILKGLDGTDAGEGFLEPAGEARANTLDRLTQGR
jgi:hypothetical protein